MGGGEPGGQPLGGAEQILPAARILVGQGRREQGAQVREALGLDGAPQVLEQRRYRPLRVRRLDAGGGEARRDDDVLGLLRREPREVVIHAFDERVGAGQGRGHLIIISSIVATSTFFFFVGQRRVYDTQAKVLNVQQNLWAAMETITRFVRGAGMGIYGCVTSTSEVDDTHVLPDFSVQAFTSQPSAMPDDGAVPSLSTASDADGYYQLSLLPGHYWICSSFRRCVEKDILAGTRRLDYSFSLGPGWVE